jgi:hypothetical protein
MQVAEIAHGGLARGWLWVLFVMLRSLDDAMFDAPDATLPTAASPPTKIFRAMSRALDGGPICGSGPCMLGVRVPLDIAPDEAGNVHPGRGGMSVTPDDPARLPPHLRPISLGGLGKLPVFAIEVGRLGPHARHRPDPRRPTRHGFVEPAISMSLSSFRTALATTRAAWRESA